MVPQLRWLWSYYWGFNSSRLWRLSWFPTFRMIAFPSLLTVFDCFDLEGEGTESCQVSDAITQRRNFTSQKTSNITLRPGFCGKGRVFIRTVWSDILLRDLRTWQHWKSYCSPWGLIYRLLDITFLNTTIWTLRSIFGMRLSWASVQKHAQNVLNYQAFSCW